MWSIERIEPARGTHRWSGLANAGRRLTFEETWRGWQSDRSLRAFWIAKLSEVAFDAYCWECPPVHDGNRLRPFECVFVSSPALARMAPQPQAFAEHFRADRSVVTFGNLGGDAMLVAPCPEGPDGNYTHLACFTRTASQEQQHSLWQAVGEATDARVSAVPTWLSTAGHGVAWLHVRLDSSPKYYRHAEYMRT
jgi:hypothetical protein